MNIPVDYAQLRFAYAPPRVLPKPAITVRKPEPPLLCAPAIAGLLPAPKAQRASVAGIMARGEIYITGDSATLDRLCQEMPDSAIPVIRLKPSQMERIPIKNHVYGEGVLEFLVPQQPEAIPVEKPKRFWERKTEAIQKGDCVAVAGFYRFCTVLNIFERRINKKDKASLPLKWVRVKAQIGKHTMERTVLYSLVSKI